MLKVPDPEEYIFALNAIDERAACESFVTKEGGDKDESLIKLFMYSIGAPFCRSAH